MRKSRAEHYWGHSIFPHVFIKAGPPFLPFSRQPERQTPRSALFRPPLHGVAVLRRPGRLAPQVVLGLERPVWLSEQLPGEEDEVGVAPGDDLVGVLRLGDEADGPRHDPRLVS